MEEASQSSISIKKATVLYGASKYINVVFQIIANVFLARLLSPEDYGIVAIVTVFTAFFALFSDIGLGTGVIQNKTLTQKDISNIFSFTVYIGIILAALFCVFSWPLSLFYKNNVYLKIGPLLAVSIFFNTLNMIPNALIMKEKRFGSVAIRNVVTAVISYAVAVMLAFLGFKYYALVFQSIISAVVFFVWNYSSSRIKLCFAPKFSSVKKILNYSIFAFCFDLLNYAARNLDNLLTGKIIGEAALGQYNKAYTLMLYPVNYLTLVVTPTLHPILAEHQDDKQYMFDVYMRVFKILSLIGLYITALCYCSSSEIVLILYGDQWIAAIPCMTALSLSVWFQMTSSSCGGIYRSIGKTKIMFQSGIMFVSVQVLMIIIGVASKDIVILAWCVSASFILKFIIEYFNLIHRGFGMSILHFLKNLLPELIIAILLGIAAVTIKQILSINNVFASFAVKAAVCLAVFLLGLKLTRQDRILKRLFTKH